MADEKHDRGCEIERPSGESEPCKAAEHGSDGHEESPDGMEFEKEAYAGCEPGGVHGVPVGCKLAKASVALEGSVE